MGWCHVTCEATRSWASSQNGNHITAWGLREHEGPVLGHDALLCPACRVNGWLQPPMHVVCVGGWQHMKQNKPSLAQSRQPRWTVGSIPCVCAQLGSPSTKLYVTFSCRLVGMLCRPAGLQSRQTQDSFCFSVRNRTVSQTQTRSLLFGYHCASDLPSSSRPCRTSLVSCGCFCLFPGSYPTPCPSTGHAQPGRATTLY